LIFKFLDSKLEDNRFTVPPYWKHLPYIGSELHWAR
jgi:hypothetical protein